MFSAHLDDDGFEILSCCCFVGIPTADHPFVSVPMHVFNGPTHCRLAMQLPGADKAEEAVFELRNRFGRDGMIRILKTMARAETARRDRRAVIRRALSTDSMDLASKLIDGHLPVTA